MKRSLAAFMLMTVIWACHDESKPKDPEKLQPNEMPAAIQGMYKDIAKSPDSVGLRFRLVDALDSLGAYQQALTEVNTLIKKDSLNYALWYRKALVQQNVKDTIGALRSYKYAIRIYPSPDAMLGVANLMAERKNDTALLLTKQVAAMRIGREYTAHCNFIDGVYYARTGQKQKALDAFNNSIINDINYPEAYMEKGFIYYDDKKLKEAEQVFETLVSVKNTYPDGYYWLAKCEEAMNNRTDAVANYQKALTLDPLLKEAKDALNRLGAN